MNSAVMKHQAIRRRASGGMFAGPVGVGAAPGVGALVMTRAAPGPTDPNWHPIPATTLRNLMNNAMFMRLRNGAHVSQLFYATWRSWNFGGRWFGLAAVQRTNTYHYFVNTRAVGTAGVPQGVGASGDGRPPAQPAANNPNWRAATTTDVAHLRATNGWSVTVANAISHGQSMFHFHKGWYKLVGPNLFILGAGSGNETGGHNRAFAGTPGMGASGDMQPVTPAPNSPNWQPLSGDALSRLQRTAGWGAAVATSIRNQNSVFHFHKAWYQIRGRSFFVLGPGSGGTTSRAFAGLPGMGATTNTGTSANSNTGNNSNQNQTSYAAATTTAAQTLSTDLTTNGAQTTTDTNATAFQQAWNSDAANSASQIAVTGLYDPATQLALSLAMATAAPASAISAADTAAAASAATPANYAVPVLAGAGALGVGLILGAVLL